MKCDNDNYYAEPCKFCDNILCHGCLKKDWVCPNDHFKSDRWKIWKLREIFNEIHEVME